MAIGYRIKAAFAPSFVSALALALLLVIGSFGSPAAQPMETKAEFAILIDVGTDSVLFQKRADDRMVPASMAKMMTALILFEGIKAGRLPMDKPFVISENAWRKGGAPAGGSAMFARVNSTVPLGDLLRGIIVQSGNDASIAAAEDIGGTEEGFARLMNEEAERIGMSRSRFANATGLPNPQQYTTARDLARLARYTITEFPELYKIYAEREFTWNKIRQMNRNPLLDMNIGADGLKTGMIAESGFGLTGSAVRDGRRLIVVVNGLKTDRERGEEARKLLEWGFRAFTQTTLFEKDDVLAEARVYGGERGTVKLRSRDGVHLLLPSSPTERVKLEVVYEGPIPAPVAADKEAGALLVRIGDQVISRTPLYTAEAVAVGGFHARAAGALKELLFGWW